MDARISVPGPSPPFFPQHPFSSTMVSKIHVVGSGLHPITSKVPSHCDILIKLQSHSNQRVMASLVLYWDTLLHHRLHRLGPILQLPCSASGKDIESQSYANLVLKCIIFSPSISFAGLPVLLRS